MSLPNWPRWLAKGSATLEECVALSLDRAPSWTQTISTTEALAPAADGDPAKRKKSKDATPAGPILRTTVKTSHPALTEPAGRERLQVLRECFADGSPLLPRADDEGGRGARVRLSDFARWAASLGWALPAPLAALAGEEALSTPGAPRRMLKRKALIDELRREWPSVKSDLSEASRPNNLLHAAMVRGQRGMWWVEDARKWAESKGRLVSSTGPAATPWAASSVKKNRIK